MPLFALFGETHRDELRRTIERKQESKNAVDTEDHEPNSPVINPGSKCVRFAEGDSYKNSLAKDTHATNPEFRSLRLDSHVLASLAPIEPESPDLRRRIQQVARFVASRPDEVRSESEMMCRKRSKNLFSFMQPNDLHYPYYEEQKRFAREREVKTTSLEFNVGSEIGSTRHYVECPELPADPADFECDTMMSSSIGKLSLFEPVKKSVVSERIGSSWISPFISSTLFATIQGNNVSEPVESSQTSPCVLPAPVEGFQVENSCVAERVESSWFSSFVSSAIFTTFQDNSGSGSEKQESNWISPPSSRIPMATSQFESSGIPERTDSRAVTPKVTLNSQFEELPSEQTSERFSIIESASHISQDPLRRIELVDVPIATIDCIETPAMSPNASSLPLAILDSKLAHLSSTRKKRREESEQNRVRFDQTRFQFYAVEHDSKDDSYLYDIEGNAKVTSFRRSTREEDALFDSLVHEHLEKDHEQRTRVKNRMFNTSTNNNFVGGLEKGTRALVSMFACRTHGSMCCSSDYDSIVVEESTNVDSNNFPAPGTTIARLYRPGEMTLRENRPEYEFENGERYIGEWNGTVREGHGVHFWPDGSRYEGQWIDSQRGGEGIHVWANGARYTGQWVADIVEGTGTFERANGDVYQGECEANKAHGKGTCIHKDGSTYEGEWVDDKQHGFGLEEFVDKSKYCGQYVVGFRTGVGKFAWKNGSNYEGQFLNDEVHGSGVITYGDGSRFDGEWCRNRMHGTGVFTHVDGQTYEGEFVSNLKHGMGSLKYPNGQIYKGIFFEGKEHGIGTYGSPGDERRGEWKNGKLQKLFSQNV